MSNYLEQGKSFLEKKEYTKAIEYFQAAIENMESLKDAHLGLAEALFAVGKSEQGKVSLFKAMILDPSNPHGLSMIQEHCFPDSIITPNTVCPPSVDQDPVINIKPHFVLGKNHYVAEQQSGNKLYFRVGAKGCTIVCPLNPDDVEDVWDGYDKPQGELVIPDRLNVNNKYYNVIAIDDFSFIENETITSILLPVSLQKIGSDAFDGTSISEITLPSAIQHIGGWGFSHTLLEEIIFPDSCKTLGNYCFFGCGRLSYVHLNEGLVKIGDHAFEDCDLHEVDIPESVRELGYSAFPRDTIIRLHGNPPKISNLDEDRYIFYVPQRKKYMYEEDEDWEYIKVNTY